jgi:polyhydroxyalkanoate synthase
VEHSALQHEHAPRPLPLFLELVREVGNDDPAIAREALKGLTVYARATRSKPTSPRPEFARIGAACLRDYGGNGPPLILVPSLINPPHILDLDPEVSLAAAVAAMDRRVLLLDWGKAADRAQLSVSDHVQQLLVPLVQKIGGSPALLGYCLGGTMAIAAANLVPVERIVTLAAPWHFARYPDVARATLQQIWASARPAAESLGALPMEVLQASFWSLDPKRTVGKFAKLAPLSPDSDEARRFAALEDWANEGEPLPLPAARELLDDFFNEDAAGAGNWRIGRTAITDRLSVPALHLTAAKDRITPAATAAEGPRVEVPSGHVGMVVGRARSVLHRELARFLRLAAGAPQG